METTSGTQAGVAINHPRYHPQLSKEGGMGIIIGCRDRQTGNKVALKTFKPKYLSRRPVRERFLDEATHWILLDRHPNIVSALDITQIGNPPQPCVVLEWIEGRYPDTDASLRSVLIRRRRPLGFIQSLGIALGIARGMRHATESLPGFIHCDLKTENILIDEQWQPHVTDMGMSRTLASLAARMNPDNKLPLPCTPGFCAPEQYDLDITIDQRADIYALGCILYEMLTGLRINPGKNLESRKQLDHEGRLREIPEVLPSSIKEIIRTCIRSDPEERYQDWGTVEAALTACYREQAKSDPISSATPKAGSRESARSRAESFLALGKSFYEFGDMPRAIDYLNQGLELARTSNRTELESRLLYQRGIVALESGSLQAAYDDLTMAMEIARHGEERELLCDIFSVMGMLYARQGEHEKAMDVLNQALDLARQQGNRSSEATILGNLGNACGQSGNPEKAADYFREVLALCNENHDEGLLSRTMANLGITSYDLGNYEEAIEYLKQALEVTEKLGDDPGRLHVLEHLWKAYATSENQLEADHYRNKYGELAGLLGRKH